MKGDIQLEDDFVPSFLNIDIQRESKEERELKKPNYARNEFIQELSGKFDKALEIDVRNGIDKAFDQVFTDEVMAKNGWSENSNSVISVANIKSEVMTEALKSLSRTISKANNANLQDS